MTGAITTEAVLRAVGMHLADIYLAVAIAAFGYTIARAVGAVLGLIYKEAAKITPAIATIVQTILGAVFTTLFEV